MHELWFPGNMIFSPDVISKCIVHFLDVEYSSNSEKYLKLAWNDVTPRLPTFIVRVGDLRL